MKTPSGDVVSSLSTAQLSIRLDSLLRRLHADLLVRERCTRPEVETDRENGVVRVHFRWSGEMGTYDVRLVHDAVSVRILHLTRDHDLPPEDSWCTAGTCDRPKHHEPPHSQFDGAVYQDSLQALKDRLAKTSRPSSQIPFAMLDAEQRRHLTGILAFSLIWGADDLQNLLAQTDLESAFGMKGSTP
jgi:hypothetical protein